MDTIYEMKLHDTLIDKKGFLITRVPGGWIYVAQITNADGKWVHYQSENYIPTAVFVPFDNEFQS